MRSNAVFHVRFEQGNRLLPCFAGMSLLRGMECLGEGAIPIGCRGGGCGVCKVQVLAGEYETGKMSRCHVSEQDEAQGIVLACRIVPRGDLRVRVLGKMRSCSWLREAHARASSFATECNGI